MFVNSAYDHTSLNAPDLVRSRKLSKLGHWLVLWMGDRLGLPVCCRPFLSPILIFYIIIFKTNI